MQDSKMISVRASTYNKVQIAQELISKSAGRQIPICEVVDRAMNNLLSANGEHLDTMPSDLTPSDTMEIN